MGIPFEDFTRGNTRYSHVYYERFYPTGWSTNGDYAGVTWKLTSLSANIKNSARKFNQEWNNNMKDVNQIILFGIASARTSYSKIIWKLSYNKVKVLIDNMIMLRKVNIKLSLYKLSQYSMVHTDYIIISSLYILICVYVREKSQVNKWCQ